MSHKHTMLKPKVGEIKTDKHGNQFRYTKNPNPPDTKERREFEVYGGHESHYPSVKMHALFMETLAKGVYYPEGCNVQVLWRKDIGFTAEQYSNIGEMLFLMKDVVGVKWIKGGE